MEKPSEKKILIVEDEISLADIMKERLESEGFKVFVALDGEKGLEIARKERPDLILIDILLPKMDGISMAREINKLKLDAFMIFLTNLSDAEHIAEASETVFTDYLVKSDVSVNDIVNKVKTKLGVG